jgi:threonyl-tRNA synthetase
MHALSDRSSTRNEFSLHPEAPPEMDGASLLTGLAIRRRRPAATAESPMDIPSPKTPDAAGPPASLSRGQGAVDALDHRAIGNRQALFHQQEDGPGMVFWHPRGFALYQTVESHIRRHMRRAGYREVRTPQLLDRALWEASGHWEKFGTSMFALEDGERRLALKPMSCPGHIQIFNRGVRSFRDLPLRFAEFGACHRDEPSGALHGLMRTRAFVQDDAHVFCSEAQIAGEVARFARLLTAVYGDFGFDDVAVCFATRPEARAGDEAQWDRAEASLLDAARAAGLSPELKPGEGAFYGPKLEFHLADRLGRRWQCGTIQADFVLPERLDAHYADSDGSRRRPVILHHAVLGSIERFLAILLEQYRGALPLWLAPDQVVVATVGTAQAAYGERVAERLRAADIRVMLDAGGERLSRKVMEARELGIPLLLAVGAREAANGTVALRHADGSQEVLALADAVQWITWQATPPSR